MPKTSATPTTIDQSRNPSNLSPLEMTGCVEDFGFSAGAKGSFEKQIPNETNFIVKSVSPERRGDSGAAYGSDSSSSGLQYEQFLSRFEVRSNSLYKKLFSS